MSNIHTNYIDFRDEHRIYFLEGNLLELVGMIADTDYDEWNKDTMSDDPSPITWYKLILNSECMFDGGHYEEGALPPVFAHRGDVLKGYQLMRYLINNHVTEPICLLGELERLGLTAVLTESECSIRIRLFPVWDGYRVESNIGFPLMFISAPKDGRKGVVLDVREENEGEETYSYKRLAEEMGEILYALREFFKKPTIDISGFSIVEDDRALMLTEVKAPESYTRFLRLVRLAAEKKKKYYDDLDEKYKDYMKWIRYEK